MAQRQGNAGLLYFAYRVFNDARRNRETSLITKRSRLRKMIDPMDITDTEFRNRYRLTKEAFLFLCGELQTKTNLKGTQRIRFEDKILCALSFYATGSYQRIVGMGQNLGQTTVSKIVTEVTIALNSLAGSFIKFPTSREERNAIKERFFGKFGIPGVCGAIDGCHFHIYKPKRELEHLFYCRKHFHSLNVQIICDSDCKILNANAKFGGATHDAFVWENSEVNAFLQQLHNTNEQVWLLGDSGYPQRPWLMTPIMDAVEGSIEARYTTAHGKARVVIENTFGRLKNRWRCLNKDRTLHYNPNKCSKIIIACCVLHNIAIQFSVPDPDGYGPDHAHSEPETAVAIVNANLHGGDDLIRGRALRASLMNRIRY